MALEQLLQQRPDIWRGAGLTAPAPPGVSSGFSALDAELPGGGWPEGALTEILGDATGAFTLTLPALARLSDEGRWLLLAAPPRLPYAPALASRGVALERLLLVRPSEPSGSLWAAEQGLRSGACGAVLIWSDSAAGSALRRLQLAAAEGEALAFLFRPEAAAAHPSPAPLRLRVRPSAQGLDVQVLKRRGGGRGGKLEVRS